MRIQGRDVDDSDGTDGTWATPIADTDLFVAMGQPSNSRYQTVWWLARRTDVTFGLPEQVCEALAIDDLDVEASLAVAVPVLVQLVEDTAVDALASNSGPTANPGDGGVSDETRETPVVSAHPTTNTSTTPQSRGEYGYRLNSSVINVPLFKANSGMYLRFWPYNPSLTLDVPPSPP